MPSKKTPDTVVSFKGFTSGILMALSLDGFEFDKVIRKAVSIYKKKIPFFGENVLVYATGLNRELTDDEGGMVRTMFQYLIAKEVIIYRENPPVEQTPGEPTLQIPPSVVPKIIAPEIPLPSDPNEFLVIGKTVRAGVVVQSSGNIVVFGDVHSGAKIIAGKSLYVFGSIKGEVSFATNKSCTQALLACLKLQAMRISVSDKLFPDIYQTLDQDALPTYILFDDGVTSMVRISQD